MTQSPILDVHGRPWSDPADGRPAATSLEDPRLSLDDPAAWDQVLGGTRTAAGVRVTPMSALGYPPLWRGLNLLANDVARLPLHVYRRTADNGKERATEHPAYRLLHRRPNRYMTAFAFRRTLTLHSVLHGNGFAAIFRDRSARPLSLHILSPLETAWGVDGSGVAAYITLIGDERVAIPAEHVLHIKSLSHDGLWGLNLCELMAEALGLGIAAREFGARFYDGEALSGGVLMVPDHFTDEKMRNTLAAWRAMAGGLQDSHKVAILQDGAKFERLSIPPEQAQFLATRQFEVKECANILGLPPHKLSDGDRVSYNSLEQENQAYLDDGLDPRLVEWESECEVKLLTESEQESESHLIEHNRAARLRMDAKTRAETHRIYMETGVYTRNDVLRIESRPTIGKAGDRRFYPSNWTADDAPPKPAPAGPPAAARRALVAAIADRLVRLQAVELRQSAKATGDPAAWGERFYGGPGDHGFRGQIGESLRPVVSAAWAVLAPGGDAAGAIGDFIGRYVQDRLDQLAQAGALEALDPGELDALAETLMPPAAADTDTGKDAA